MPIGIVPRLRLCWWLWRFEINFEEIFLYLRNWKNSFQKVECLRNKLQSLTAQPNLKLSLWTLVFAWTVYPLSISGIWLSKYCILKKTVRRTRGETKPKANTPTPRPSWYWKSYVDHVITNAKPIHFEAMLYLKAMKQWSRSSLKAEFWRWDTYPEPTGSRLVGCWQNQLRHQNPKSNMSTPKTKSQAYWRKATSPVMSQIIFFVRSTSWVFFDVLLQPFQSNQQLSNHVEEDKAGRKTWRKGTCGGEIEDNDEFGVEACQSPSNNTGFECVKQPGDIRRTTLEFRPCWWGETRCQRFEWKHRFEFSSVAFGFKYDHQCGETRGGNDKNSIAQDCLCKVCWPGWESLLECTTKIWSSTGRRHARDRRQRDDLGDIHVRDNEGGSTSWTTLSREFTYHQEHGLLKGQTVVRHFTEINLESEGWDI